MSIELSVDLVNPPESLNQGHKILHRFCQLPCVTPISVLPLTKTGLGGEAVVGGAAPSTQSSTVKMDHGVIQR